MVGLFRDSVVGCSHVSAELSFSLFLFLNDAIRALMNRSDGDYCKSGTRRSSLQKPSNACTVVLTK